VFFYFVFFPLTLRGEGKGEGGREAVFWKDFSQVAQGLTPQGT
jgi:hypothetical protein